MNRTAITREREAAAIVASALAHPATAAMLREAEMLHGFWAGESADHFGDLLADDGGLRDLVRIPVAVPRIDPLDPLTSWAITHGIEVVPGNQCMSCGEAVGKVERDGCMYVVCLAALSPDPCCNWSRPNLIWAICSKIPDLPECWECIPYQTA